MFSDKKVIGISAIMFAAALEYNGHTGSAVLMFPLYAIWLTVHNIEVKINALLFERGLQVDTR